MVAHLAPAKIEGTLTAPPSKSIAHRLLLCAALARGTSHIENIDFSVDIYATLAALGQWGAAATSTKSGQSITGTAGQILAPMQPVNCAESGSTLRFLIPLLGLAGKEVQFTGAERLFQRPLNVYQTIFEEQGLLFVQNQQGLTIKGPLRAGSFTLPGNVSSQFISGLLFALPLLPQSSTLHIQPPFESRSYVELTRSAQHLFGINSQWQGPNTLHIPGGQQYVAANCRVEGDWSQAAFPAVLGAVQGGIAVAGLNGHSAQGDRVICEILERCGAKVAFAGDILHIMPPAEGLVAAGTIDLANCPDLGPILCTLALFCRGDTHIVNAGRLRIKESDRIASMQQMLGKMGGKIQADEDSIVVTGSAAFVPNATVQACNDHRVAMALSVAAWGAKIPLTIQGAEAVGKSWPTFFSDFAALGAHITQEDANG